MLLLFSSSIFATGVDLNKFQNIVVDLRGSRGGNGDVSAGFLFARQLIQDKGVKNLTLLVDDKTQNILNTLLGYKVKDGDKIWDGSVSVRSYEKITEPLESVDFLLQFVDALVYLL